MQIIINWGTNVPYENFKLHPELADASLESGLSTVQCHGLLLS